MITHEKLEQGSPQWHELRRGKVGGSECAHFLVGGRTKLGTGAMSLIYSKVGELMAGAEIEPYVSQAMERGSLLESYAREEYEKTNFVKVQQVGYIEKNRLFGFSPDGLVGADGLIEIKCPLAAEFVRFRVTGEIDKKHNAQIQWGLWITGRKWCDYVVYHPDAFQPLEVVRIEPDADVQAVFTDTAKLYEEEFKRVESVMFAPKK